MEIGIQTTVSFNLLSVSILSKISILDRSSTVVMFDIYHYQESKATNSGHPLRNSHSVKVVNVKNDKKPETTN